MTRRERVLMVVVAGNMVRVGTTSRKYLKYYDSVSDHYFYVGKHGALRRGATLRESISFTYAFDEIKPKTSIIRRLWAKFFIKFTRFAPA